jgi:Anti-sigma-K factor rskA/Putative zinc-finger
MAFDTSHALAHPETAGWALGALDPADRAGFEDHLRSCEQCQAQVAAFTPVASSLALAAPAAEPPGDLELKVVAAVQHAVMTQSTARARPESSAAPRAHRWWHLHWSNPLYAGLAAAAVTAVAFIASTLFQTAPALAATISLRAQPGFTGSGMATARRTQGGFEISLTVKNLPVPGPGQFYECWYAGPDNRPGHPELITAGTFTVGSSGTQTLSMWSAADPATFKIMQITLEQPGDAGQHGQVILAGTART